MDIKHVMDIYGNQDKYNLLTHNCHMAQEFTRFLIGLNVKYPYTKSNIYNIFNYINNHKIKNVILNLKNIENPSSEEINIPSINDIDNIDTNDINNPEIDNIDNPEINDIDSSDIDYTEINGHDITIDLDRLDILCNILDNPREFIIDKVLENIFYNTHLENNISLIVNILLSKDKLHSIINIGIDKITGIHISSVIQDFKHHGNYFNKTVDTGLLLFDIAGYTNPYTSLIQISKVLLKISNKLRTHNRNVSCMDLNLI